MSVVPVLVPILLPESLLQTNRFPGFSIPTINRFAVFGDVENSSTLGCLSQTLPGDTHNGVYR
mgnify:FL=1